MPFDPTTIQSAQLTPLNDTFYRSVDFVVLATITGATFLDGTHSGASGGRYNSSGSPPTAYFAGSQTLASLECEHEAFILGLGPLRNPRIVCSVKIGNASVLDLTNAIVRHHLSVSEDDITITTPAWRHLNHLGQLSIPQQIGAAARARNDVDGILYPSWLAKALSITGLPHFENLVLFMDPTDGKRHRNPNLTIRLHDPTGIIP